MRQVFNLGTIWLYDPKVQGSQGNTRPVPLVSQHGFDEPNPKTSFWRAFQTMARALLPGFTNVRAAVVAREQLKQKHVRAVDHVAYVNNGVRWVKKLKSIDKEEQAEMRRHRGGPWRYGAGYKAYYKRFHVLRALANKQRLKREDTKCKQATTEHIKRTQSGFFPGTSFQLRFRF